MNTKCPICGRPGKPIAGDYYQCGRGHVFDPDDEGIHTTHTDPAKAAEAKEEYERRKTQRRKDGRNGR